MTPIPSLKVPILFMRIVGTLFLILSAHTLLTSPLPSVAPVFSILFYLTSWILSYIDQLGENQNQIIEKLKIETKD